MDIASRILELCRQKKITPNRLADLSCLTQSTVQNIVSGRNNSTTIDTIEKICEGLNITIVDFFTESEFSADALEELRIFKEYLHYKYIVKSKKSGN